MQVAASIFKAYDIRGIVGQTLNEAVAEHLGRAFGTAARIEGESVVAVGRDGRLSGPLLSQALMLPGLVAVVAWLSRLDRAGRLIALYAPGTNWTLLLADLQALL